MCIVEAFLQVKVRYPCNKFPDCSNGFVFSVGIYRTPIVNFWSITFKNDGCQENEQTIGLLRILTDSFGCLWWSETIPCLSLNQRYLHHLIIGNLHQLNTRTRAYSNIKIYLFFLSSVLDPVQIIFNPYHLDTVFVWKYRYPMFLF